MANGRLLNRDESLLVVVDVQEGYREKTVEYGRMVRSVRTLVEAAKALAIPTLVTEQYPQGLGHTVAEVSDAFAAGQMVIEKMSMSCCGQPAFVECLHGLRRGQVVLCGIEAHACVNQTAHDLIARGYQVHLPYDAISARFELDYRVAWEKMLGSGVVPTTVETVCLEWVRVAGTPEFKAIHKLIK